MTQYPAGPYTLEFPTIFNELGHVIELNCDAVGTPTTGDDPTTVFLRTRDNVGATLDDSANAIWDLLRAFFNATTLCSTYNLWKRNPDNNDRLFISGGVLANPNGSSATANVPANQCVMTWRSGNGNIMKISLVENIITSNSRVPLASSTAPMVTALSAFVLSDANVIMARDRSFPVASMNVSFSQNEKVFNRRFRS